MAKSTLLGTGSDNTMRAGKETKVEKPRILRPLAANQARCAPTRASRVLEGQQKSRFALPLHLWIPWRTERVSCPTD